MALRDTTEATRLGPQMIARRTRYGALRVLEKHSHQGAALSIPFAGEFTEIFGRNELRIDKRRALYKSPGFAHGNVVGPRGFDGVLVEISGERQRWISDAVGPLGENHVLEEPQVRRLICSFRAAWQGEVPGRLLILESLVLQLLARLQRGGDHEGWPRWLQGVVDALHDSFPRRPALGQLAHDAGVHPVHLAQTFSRHLGCSIGDYVERLRIGAVQKALREPDLSLAQIALRTGFADQSHMTRVFARAVGVTPGRHRRAAKAKSVQNACDRSRTARQRR